MHRSRSSVLFTLALSWPAFRRWQRSLCCRAVRVEMDEKPCSRLCGLQFAQRLSEMDAVTLRGAVDSVVGAMCLCDLFPDPPRFAVAGIVADRPDDERLCT